ncbi:MAG: T9SS type A sorting domain-containing protein [Ignavibacteriae bacterium]|nr:T9SS type A sorting domain-containing protein [Ignavibacteriota bacterium]MCB9221976.1 T9SS type A sorting domain-containing protein [Ignavibacteria bacterium]
MWKIFNYIYDIQNKGNIENEIIISPNPSNGLVNITLDCLSPYIKYQIDNTSGQNLESKVIANNSNLVIDFNNYPVGIYYLTIECNRQPKTYKIGREG